MKRFFNIAILLFLVLTVLSGVAWADQPIASAQFTQSGMIHVILSNGQAFDISDNMANRHRRRVAEWIAQGNTIAPADPPTPLTQEQKIRRDPDFPRPSVFIEAIIDCRFNSDCTAALALRNRLNDLRAKYPQ